MLRGICIKQVECREKGLRINKVSLKRGLAANIILGQTDLLEEILRWFWQMMKEEVQQQQEMAERQGSSMCYRRRVRNCYENSCTVCQQSFTLSHGEIMKNKHQQLKMLHI